jgi:hypothetical protein
MESLIGRVSILSVHGRPASYLFHHAAKSPSGELPCVHSVVIKASPQEAQAASDNMLQWLLVRSNLGHLPLKSLEYLIEIQDAISTGLPASLIPFQQLRQAKFGLAESVCVNGEELV